MREIKFRAWFAKEKAMVQVDNLELLGRSGHAEVSAKHDFEKGGWYSPLKESTNRKTVVDGSKNQVPRVVLMQYTGLKDENGTEIYEGDIVHFVDFDNTGGLRGDREHTGIVKYQSGIYEIWKNNDSEYYGSDGAFILNHAWLQDDEFEVIGNIYENPELLEVEANA
ncbi:YopX family protein [Psychrobacillus sp. FSL K6-4615]|uniref:YopX family protein n=1 Tax=Psychrobacillus sp. FSL K6-4615 TaxID=2921551 RepID=UPI0030F5E96F